MLLIPEQIRYLKEAIRELKLEIKEYESYFLDRNITNSETTFRSIVGSDVIDNQFQAKISKLKIYEDAIATATYVREISKDQIGIGSKFKLRFEGEETAEEFQLIDTFIGTSLQDEIVTSESPLGKNLIGKKAGEDFSYSIESGNSKFLVSGTVEEIIPPAKNAIDFIRNKYVRDRKSGTAKQETKMWAETIDLEESKLQQQTWLTITESQKELLETELERLEKEPKRTKEEKTAIATRMTKIKELLKRPISHPEGNKIAVGSSFSVMLFEPEQTVFKRLELVNQAYSDELNDEYVERISALGMVVYGLGEGEEFVIKKDNQYISGQVYDIDNRKDSIRTTSPLVYQKSKGRLL